MTKLSSHIFYLVSAALGLALSNAALGQESDAPAEPATETAAETAAASPAPSISGDPTQAPSSLTGNLIQDIKFYYSIGRHDRALEMIQDAPEEARQNPDVRFTHANILALRKEWQNACNIYEDLLEVWPTTETIGGVQTRFNLSECYYVLGQYEDALKLYNKLYTEKENRQGQTYEYLQFKIFLTNQLLGNREQAAEIFKQFDEFSMSPNYYYASAVNELVDGDTQEGLEWVRSAWNIYHETINNAYTEALQESGLLVDMDPTSAVDNARVESGTLSP